MRPTTGAAAGRLRPAGGGGRVRQPVGDRAPARVAGALRRGLARPIRGAGARGGGDGAGAPGDGDPGAAAASPGDRGARGDLPSIFFLGDASSSGSGTGWEEREFATVGIPLKERGARLDEGLEVIRRLLSEESVTHHGRFYHLDDVSMAPRPPQAPRVWIAGGSLGHAPETPDKPYIAPQGARPHRPRRRLDVAVERQRRIDGQGRLGRGPGLPARDRTRPARR